eukprot:2148039-Rhodomonas_salina.1
MAAPLSPRAVAVQRQSTTGTKAARCRATDSLQWRARLVPSAAPPAVPRARQPPPVAPRRQGRAPPKSKTILALAVQFVPGKPLISPVVVLRPRAGTVPGA